MSSIVPDPDLDLTISRVIRAPRRVVWSAWTSPRSFERWWVPAPATCRVVAMDLRPGGAFTTQIREGDGPLAPHMDGCFLAVDDLRRIVFTDALVGGWRPAEKAFITASITFDDHPEGTAYGAVVMHRSGADRSMHERMGFHDGWGAVTAQLAALAEQESR